MLSKLRFYYGLNSSFVAAFAGLAVFAYGVVVALEPMTGIFGGATVALGVLVLSDLVERGYPPVLGRRGTLGLVVGVVVFAGLWFATRRPLLVFGLAPLLAVAVWGIARFRVNGYPESMGRRRTLTTAFVAAGLVTYGSVVGSTAFLVGICAAILVAIASWVTSPAGPVVATARSE
ncbi:hypothetical protein [Haloferax sp. DFSO52]|uniref:hypothetical protein n=1 Tax=Haloferax sp. DFSO52 TaxID=3388505 RepID=UPI003A8AB8B0